MAHVRPCEKGRNEQEIMRKMCHTWRLMHVITGLNHLTATPAQLGMLIVNCIRHPRTASAAQRRMNPTTLPNSCRPITGDSTCSMEGIRAARACAAVDPAATAAAPCADAEAACRCRFTQSRCQHEQQPCPVKEEAGHCGYDCRTQRFTVLHGSLLHAWGPILSVAALSGVSNKRKGRRKRGLAAGDGDIDEVMEGEVIDEEGIADEDGAMRADVEELLELAECDAASEDDRCDLPRATPALHRVVARCSCVGSPLLGTGSLADRGSCDAAVDVGRVGVCGRERLDWARCHSRNRAMPTRALS